MRESFRPAAWGLAIFLFGLLIRVALILPNRAATATDGPEPVQVALSLAKTGRYADAYGPGAGPTAHCAPLHPIILSGLFRVFGTGSRGALAMNVAGAAAAMTGFALLPVLSVAGGLGLSTGVLAGAAGALLPVNFWVQTNGSFDAPFTSAALAALALLLCHVWFGRRFMKTEGLTFGIAAGFGCLLNPALIPVLAAWSVVSAVRFRMQARRVLMFFAVAAVCVLAMLTPWAVRNYRALGSPIWTRSNFGLELQVSNNDTMTADLERNVRMPGFAQLHPFTGKGEFARVQSMGEVAYQRSKERQALAWIGSHKRQFLRLTAERFRLFWFPNMKRPLQSAFEAALTLLGLSGLVLLFAKNRPLAWLLSVPIVVYPAVYYLIQVSARYRFPLEPILFLLAAYLLSSLTRGVLEMTSNRSGNRRWSLSPDAGPVGVHRS